MSEIEKEIIDVENPLICKDCGFIGKNKRSISLHKTKCKVKNLENDDLEYETPDFFIGSKKKIVPFSKNVHSEVGVMRYVRFFYDRETRNSKLFSDVNKDSTFDYAGGTYTLCDVALYHEGKPVYFIIRGFNFSIGLDFNLANKKLVERGYTPEDMKNQLTSKHINRLFKITNKIGFREIVFTLMLMCITAMTTVFICLAIFLK